MYDIVYTNKFNRDMKKAKRQKRDLKALEEVVTQIVNKQPLDPMLKDHELKGDHKGNRELHINSDWLLIYKIEEANNRVSCIRCGTHSELFS